MTAAIEPERLDAEQMIALLDRLQASAGNDQVLRRRDDAMVARVTSDLGGTVIVKLWVRPGIRGLMRRITRTGSADREFRVLDRLRRAGASVPAALGHCRICMSGQPYTDALFIEDLGPCAVAADYAKALHQEGRWAELAEFEEQMIATTAAMVRAGVVDTDHGLINTVVTATGRPVRLDFEVARCVALPSAVPGAYGRMLGRLILTYGFAVQPDVERIQAFALHTAEVIRPPRRVLRVAKEYAAEMFERQRQEIGMDVRLGLPW